MQGVAITYNVWNESTRSIIIFFFVDVLRIVSIKGIWFPARIKAKNFLVLLQILFKESDDFFTVE